MLDILRFAHEKGMEDGEIRIAREMIIEALEESVGIVPAYIAERVRSVSMLDMLKGLLRQAVKCKKNRGF